MKLNILIIEDQFLEAENLSIILKNAGHTVHGIAKSVDQAMGLLKKSNPDIALVDIVLRGELNGIDLARLLDKKSIPFIFLSANSNATTLEQAIATKPYGLKKANLSWCHAESSISQSRTKKPGLCCSSRLPP